eukprot:364620-Chlamydomonas_euryale.AAC.7
MEEVKCGGKDKEEEVALAGALHKVACAVARGVEPLREPLREPSTKRPAWLREGWKCGGGVGVEQGPCLWLCVADGAHENREAEPGGEVKKARLVLAQPDSHMISPAKQ